MGGEIPTSINPNASHVTKKSPENSNDPKLWEVLNVITPEYQKGVKSPAASPEGPVVITGSIIIPSDKSETDGSEI